VQKGPLAAEQFPSKAAVRYVRNTSIPDVPSLAAKIRFGAGPVERSGR